MRKDIFIYVGFAIWLIGAIGIAYFTITTMIDSHSPIIALFGAISLCAWLRLFISIGDLIIIE